MREDRRTKKTKQALRMGLAELLEEKTIQQITVKELVEKADIHRATFYANFEDIYDLYNHMEDIAIDNIRSTVTSGYAFEPKKFFEMLLAYITDNQQMCRLFFGGKVSKTFSNRVNELFLDSYLDYLSEKYNLNRENEKLRYYELYCFTGTLAIIEKWVTGEFTCSKEELIEMLVDIDSNWSSFIAKQFANQE